MMGLLERAGQGRPGVLQQPGQAHAEPGCHDDDRARVAENLFRLLADPEYPPGVVGNELIVGIERFCCSHRLPPIPLGRDIVGSCPRPRLERGPVLAKSGYRVRVVPPSGPDRRAPGGGFRAVTYPWTAVPSSIS